MSFYRTKLFEIDTESIKVDRNELTRRLIVDKSFDLSMFDSYTKKAHEKAKPKCVSIRVPANIDSDGVCNLGFATVKSRDLAKNLDGCSEAFVFAVTLGIDTERYLSSLSKTSPSQHFICDGYYSALCESACDVAENIIKDGFECKPRFSPGYGDLPLSFQKDVLSALGTCARLGITLTNSFLMVPQKSVTAIMGIKNNT